MWCGTCGNTATVPSTYYPMHNRRTLWKAKAMKIYGLATLRGPGYFPGCNVSPDTTNRTPVRVTIINKATVAGIGRSCNLLGKHDMTSGIIYKNNSLCKPG